MKFKYTGFVLILALMVIPALQKQFNLIQLRPLDGDFIPNELPVLTKESWLEGEFQSKFDPYLEQNIGFRDFLVRLQNQLDFSIFRKPHAEGVVVGKKKMLFEYDYIRAYTGLDFVGYKFITKKLNRLKYIQEYLLKEKGIHLVLIFEPGKASFYPEFIPNHYIKQKKDISNYSLYTQMAAELGIRHIDYNKYFLKLKGSTPYPLFPPSGIHWSISGMTYAADSILRYIESLNYNLGQYDHDSIHYSKQALLTDNDVGKAMNLLIPVEGPELAYPVYKFAEDDTQKKPMVLAIADSYYWNIFNTRIPKNLFANEAFWYFNSKVYPDTYYEPVFVKDLDLKKEIEKQDIIMLMVTERFLYRFDWRFIDMVYDLYAPGFIKDPEYKIANRILGLNQWFENVLEKSAVTGESLESQLWEESRYLFHNEKENIYLSWYGPDMIMKDIANDKEWMEKIREEAEQKALPLEKILFNHADYMFWNNKPDVHKKHQILWSIHEEINQSESLRDSLKILTETCYLDDELAKRTLAELIYKEREIAKIESSIRNTPDWLNDIKAKARRKKQELDLVIREDAEYVFKSKETELYGD